MPINENGEFVKRNEETLRSFLENELRSEFGEDVDLSQSSVFSSLIKMLSGLLAENQEVDLQEVYNSAFLETAEGVNLDRVVEILGITRFSAIKATGVVTFSRNNPVLSTRSINENQVVQSEGSDPIQYLTDSETILNFYDGFEDNNIIEYTETPTGVFETSSENAFDGTFSVKATGSGAIYRSDKQVRTGDKFSCRVFNTGGAVADVLFGTQDENNTYKVRVSDTELQFIKVDSGVETILGEKTAINVANTAWNEIEVDWGVINSNDESQFEVRLKDSVGNKIATVSATDGFRLSGGFGFASNNTNVVYFDNYASRGRAADITADTGGAEGNVASNSVTTAPIVPSAVNKINNPYPIGGIEFTQISGESYTLGEDEEPDRQLRQRARESLGAGGAATVNAIAAAIQEVQNVRNVTLIENDEEVEDSQGRPPFSVEPVVLGGADQEIIDAIGNTRGVTSHVDGGHIGTKVEGVWTSDVTDDKFTFSFSRPNKLSIDMTLDIVVNDNYIGDEQLRDRIVEYIGGTLSDGSSEIGLNVNTDVKIDAIEDIIIGADDTGVVGVISLSTTPAPTTDANGLDVVDVSTNEVASTDATDGSITITSVEE